MRLRHVPATKLLVPFAVTLACSSGDPQAPLGSSQAALIVDQVHNSGATGFYFLPPMVAQPTTAGVFDASESPVVRIDEMLAGSSTVLRTVATFTTTTGPGSETVRVDATGTNYVVNWHTKQFDLSTAFRYRINVLLGERVLGLADVDVVASGNQLKNVDTQQYVPLLDDRTLPIKFWLNGCAPVVCVALDQCHVADVCNSQTGQCDNPVALDGTSCGSGASAGICQSGACVATCLVGGPPLSSPAFSSAIYPSSDHPQHNVSGDLNHDGYPDVVVGTWATRGVSVYLNRGDGTLGPQQRYSFPSYTEDAVLADVDLDTNLDLITSYDDLASVGGISVQRGNGDGTFRSAEMYPAGIGAETISVVDLNHDALPDIVAVTIHSHALSILLGTGNGKFGATMMLPGGIDPVGLGVGDFNHDGNVDLVSANNSERTLSVWLGRGDGTFDTLPRVRPTGFPGVPGFLAVGRFDCDPNDDLAIISGPENDISILVGQGDGTFGPVTTYADPGHPSDIHTADVNADGVLDLVVSHAQSQDISVWYGTGNGQFGNALRIQAGTSPNGVDAVDMDQDGRLDFVVANQSPSTITVLRRGQ